jgi:hypothetical protein
MISTHKKDSYENNGPNSPDFQKKKFNFTNFVYQVPKIAKIQNNFLKNSYVIYSQIWLNLFLDDC